MLDAEERMEISFLSRHGRSIRSIARATGWRAISIKLRTDLRDLAACRCQIIIIASGGRTRLHPSDLRTP